MGIVQCILCIMPITILYYTCVYRDLKVHIYIQVQMGGRGGGGEGV